MTADPRTLTTTYTTLTWSDDGRSVTKVLDLIERLGPFDPRRRWLRRLDSVGRLDLAHRHELLTAEQTAALQALTRSAHRRYRFCHGDITARNVLRADDTGEPTVTPRFLGLDQRPVRAGAPPSAASRGTDPAAVDVGRTDGEQHGLRDARS